MNIKIISIVVISLSLLLFSCSQKQKTESVVSHQNLFKEFEGFLGKPLDSIKEISGYTRNVTTEEDEGVIWKGLEYSQKGEVAFLIESNWEHPEIANRITVCSKKIKFNDLYVGQKIGNIKHLISDNIPSSPDGFLFVSLKNNPKISLQIDLSMLPEDNPLVFGCDNINEIPDTLQVESIVFK